MVFPGLLDSGLLSALHDFDQFAILRDTKQQVSV